MRGDQPAETRRFATAAAAKRRACSSESSARDTRWLPADSELTRSPPPRAVRPDAAIGVVAGRGYRLANLVQTWISSQGRKDQRRP